MRRVRIRVREASSITLGGMSDLGIWFHHCAQLFQEKLWLVHAAKASAFVTGSANSAIFLHSNSKHHCLHMSCTAECFSSMHNSACVMNSATHCCWASDHCTRCRARLILGVADAGPAFGVVCMSFRGFLREISGLVDISRCSSICFRSHGGYMRSKHCLVSCCQIWKCDSFHHQPHRSQNFSIIFPSLHQVSLLSPCRWELLRRKAGGAGCRNCIPCRSCRNSCGCC